MDQLAGASKHEILFGRRDGTRPSAFGISTRTDSLGIWGGAVHNEMIQMITAMQLLFTKQNVQTTTFKHRHNATSLLPPPNHLSASLGSERLDSAFSTQLFYFCRYTDRSHYHTSLCNFVCQYHKNQQI